ncbi:MULTISPECIES: hypothetical protein, partial [Prevotellaceae]|uniref:hypothetical protein n=1 Tax=Prevotella sp. TaxID=59823 RepID=UPI0040277483
AQLRDWSRKSMNFLLHQRTQERKQFSAMQVLTQANLKSHPFCAVQKFRGNAIRSTEFSLSYFIVSP